MAQVNHIERALESFRWENTPLLLASGVSFAVGYVQYAYNLWIPTKYSRSPMPYWMHSFYLAHDSAWAYLLGQYALLYDNHWFLRGTSLALYVWSGLEIWCIYCSIFKHRNQDFRSIFGPNPPLGSVMVYAAALQAAMYALIFIGIHLMGEGCFLHWFCLTNVMIALGPTHDILRRDSREGLPVGLFVVNLFGTMFTFAPFGFFAQALPEVFARSEWYLPGIVLAIYCAWCLYVVVQLPEKSPKSANSSAIKK